ncbi:MAG: DUF4339 domain-containing protein, partial [Pirellulaceae bacterium]|nr:DUF4339 domain-containing protein [Pirellulaceae bacterium]
MSKTWYYHRLGGQPRGPVSWTDLERLHSEGRLSGSDRLWRDGMAEWMPAGSLGLGTAVTDPQPPPVSAPPRPPQPPQP